MNEKEESPGQSYGGLLAVLGALLALTAVSVAAARLYTGPLRAGVALGIAGLKSALVLVFFMRLREAGPAVAGGFLATVLTLAVFMALTFSDVLYR
ncbi:MAG: hypothetical protein A2X32_02070 [Elusimicrobia bacterium GWC2_64_44]|nr:MAG: hypothetical protein A2X32_02070 [Elusimicrobia bacterium GWC2_64_44]